ncbi:short-chain dehydrogenase [Desulfoluna limicola]|uniref:Short-chain dehydrogenase n=1 Tax=Desulfoluna limicola TaxID=2810562 RepID=A0ABM7PIW0_9BACT|nr:SDR family oxidoreductase [Desulfoluna limicola]BCS97316.1 short-chain dehydrogenase [Desulfoluna limicola]
MKFHGKTVLVVGGSCEMALALAPALEAAGLLPVLTFRSEEAKKRSQTALGNQGSTTCFFDLGKALEPEGFSELDACFSDGGPDYLVDFAHGNLESLVATAATEDVGHYLHENVTCRAALVKWAARRMTAKRFGRMLYVSSTAAALQNGGQGFYAASKKACEALYQGIGIEMGKKGITSAILRPGYVTAGRASTFMAENEAWVKKRVPLGRAASPSEVAETLLFLLSDAARPINATTITMDGGLTACK